MDVINLLSEQITYEWMNDPLLCLTNTAKALESSVTSATDAAAATTRDVMPWPILALAFLSPWPHCVWPC